MVNIVNVMDKADPPAPHRSRLAFQDSARRSPDLNLTFTSDLELLSHQLPLLVPLLHQPPISFVAVRSSISSIVLPLKPAISALHDPDSACPLKALAAQVPRHAFPAFCADHVPCMRISSPASFRRVQEPTAAFGSLKEVCPDHVPRKTCVPAVAVHVPLNTGGAFWARAKEAKRNSARTMLQLFISDTSCTNGERSFSVTQDSFTNDLTDGQSLGAITPLCLRQPSQALSIQARFQA
jgi:hypothetical protein